MNREQVREIADKVCDLFGSRAHVKFHLDNNNAPHLSVHKTGTGYQITDMCLCVRVESCIRINDYNTIIKVLNKIIKQAKI